MYALHGITQRKVRATRRRAGGKWGRSYSSYFYCAAADAASGTVATTGARHQFDLNA